MSDRPSRRTFIGAAGLAGLTAAEAAAFGGRHRRRCLTQPCPPCPQPLPPDPNPGPDSGLRVRQNVNTLSSQQVDAIRRGVAAMQALDTSAPSDPRGWRFQANIHGNDAPLTNVLWGQCTHSNGASQITLQFLTWHRAYLHFFERILRTLSGEPTLTLPYWDWTADRTLPAAYREYLPGGNPLRDDTRQFNLNDGDPLIPTAGRGLPDALAAPGFSDAAGHSYLLENGPHNSIHGGIGGHMGNTRTAGRDPVFWVHHANVDRLWDVWLAQGGRANPADSGFLDEGWSFADETGAMVRVRVRDVLGSAQLGYRYDNAPPSPAPASTTSSAPVMAAAPPVVVAASAGDAPLAEMPSRPVEYKFNRVPVQGRPAAVAAITARAGGPPRTFLEVEGVSAEQPADGVLFGVYLNATDAEIQGPQEEQFFLGNIGLFGRTRVERQAAGHRHKEAAEDAFTEAFDATQVIERLKQLGRWDPSKFEVVIVPQSGRPGRRAAAQVQAQAAAATQASKLSYKRVRLVAR